MITKENLLQEQADRLIFAESEVTPELKAACELQGVKLNIVPDIRYEEEICMGFGEWLINNSAEG